MSIIIINNLVNSYRSKNCQHDMENDYPLFIISTGTRTDCILKGLSGKRK